MRVFFTNFQPYQIC